MLSVLRDWLTFLIVLVLLVLAFSEHFRKR